MKRGMDDTSPLQELELVYRGMGVKRIRTDKHLDEDDENIL